MTLYTLGYAIWTPEQVRDEVLQRSALLVDVRLAPATEKPGFSREELQVQFGDRYAHIGGFGNANYQGGPIKLQNPDDGLWRLDVATRRLEPEALILMCGCKDWRTCHRREVAAFVADHLDVEEEHLEPPHVRAQTTLKL